MFISSTRSWLFWYRVWIWFQKFSCLVMLFRTCVQNLKSFQIDLIHFSTSFRSWKIQSLLSSIWCTIRDSNVVKCYLRPRVGPCYVWDLLVYSDGVPSGSGIFQGEFWTSLDISALWWCSGIVEVRRAHFWRAAAKPMCDHKLPMCGPQKSSRGHRKGNLQVWWSDFGSLYL